MKTVERVRQLWREQAGSQGLEAAGAALAAALIVLALLAAAPTTGGAIQRALGCAAAVLSGGGGCGGGEGVTQTAPPAGDQPQEPEKEDCGGWCQVGGFFKGVGGAAVDTAKGLWSLGGDVVGLATGDRETREKYGALIDAFQNDPGGTLRELGSAIVAPIVEDWKAGRYGEAIGRGSFEVLSTVIGGKGIDKLGKLGKVDNVLTGAGRYGDEAGDAGRLVPCLGATPGRGRLPGLAAPARACTPLPRGLPPIDRYGSMKGKLDDGFQANHLNQDAAFRDIIPSNDGAAIALRGNAFTQPGTPHYAFHQSLEGFWNQYRPGGAKFLQTPTNGEYSQALNEALRAAGLPPEQAAQVEAIARANRQAHGLLDSEPVPRIPGRINQKQP